MRPTLTLAAAVLAASTGCAPKPEPQAPAMPAPALMASPSSEGVSPPPQVQATLDFGRDVQPVLARHCDPCHAPGGKMYARLPFDDPATVASHPEGILRRLKGDDRAVVQRWIAAQPVR
jgi:hypothetical protein